MELVCGFLGLLAHSLLSITQARRRTKKTYGYRDYIKEYPYALMLAGVVLVGTYIAGIWHVQEYGDLFLPPVLAEMLHEVESDELMWLFWGFASMALAKLYGKKKD